MPKTDRVAGWFETVAQGGERECVWGGGHLVVAKRGECVHGGDADEGEGAEVHGNLQLLLVLGGGHVVERLLLRHRSHIWRSPCARKPHAQRGVLCVRTSRASSSDSVGLV